MSVDHALANIHEGLRYVLRAEVLRGEHCHRVGLKETQSAILQERHKLLGMLVLVEATTTSQSAGNKACVGVVGEGSTFSQQQEVGRLGLRGKIWVLGVEHPLGQSRSRISLRNTRRLGLGTWDKAPSRRTVGAHALARGHVVTRRALRSENGVGSTTGWARANVGRWIWPSS